MWSRNVWGLFFRCLGPHAEINGEKQVGQTQDRGHIALNRHVSLWRSELINQAINQNWFSKQWQRITIQ